ncbi:MAG: hypothetical protein MPK31_07210 [Gammaproteobacteria bacterium]|nr:hypothetical protein [Gammaproteobacteria bacterium]
MIAFFDMEVGGFGKVSGILDWRGARRAGGLLYSPAGKISREKCPRKMSVKNVRRKCLLKKISPQNAPAKCSRKKITLKS